MLPIGSVLKKLAQLKLTKHQRAGKLFLIEGPHLVDEARQAGLLVQAYSVDGRPGTTFGEFKNAPKTKHD
ncbi:hypothetical protein [Mycoplasma sp. ATU-Cv-508]|uniref:hypothetical protein n=1 Tax=Mycoplasma sp. ATU-Cv-508 TaxID=2048001 RepID=UPI001374FF50